MKFFKMLSSVGGAIWLSVLILAHELKVFRFKKQKLEGYSFETTSTINGKKSKTFCGAMCNADQGCQAFNLDDDGFCHFGRVVKDELKTFQGYVEESILKQLMHTSHHTPAPLSNMKPSKLMIVGSNEVSAHYKAAIIDLKNNQTACPSVLNYLHLGYGSIGTHTGDEALVCGGGFAVFSCYEYRQAHNHWIPHANMTEKRQHSAAIWIDNERWWITGGETTLLKKSTEIYDTTTNSFTPFLDLPIGIAKHHLVRFNNTHIIMLGGSKEAKDTYLFNLETKDWTAGPHTIIARTQPQAGLIRFENGTEVIALIGGIGMNSVELLDNQNLAWRMGPALPRPSLYGECMVQLEDTFLIVGGVSAGDKILSFDIGNEEWKELPLTLPFLSLMSSCFFVPDDFVQCP